MREIKRDVQRYEKMLDANKILEKFGHSGPQACPVPNACPCMFRSPSHLHVKQRLKPHKFRYALII